MNACRSSGILPAVIYPIWCHKLQNCVNTGSRLCTCLCTPFRACKPSWFITVRPGSTYTTTTDFLFCAIFKNKELSSVLVYCAFWFKVLFLLKQEFWPLPTLRSFVKMFQHYFHFLIWEQNSGNKTCDLDLSCEQRSIFVT